MQKTARIFVAGHNGMVGSAIVRRLETDGYTHLVLKTRSELDLTNQNTVKNFFAGEKPEYVFLAAAKVGGILANNTYRAQFLYENVMIQSNVIDASFQNGVKKLLFLGSSCIYPKHAPHPMKEEYLLTGELEPSNEPYAIAKIAGIKMCQAYNMQYQTNFISCMPTNLYGSNDNFDLETSHVLPALIRKFHEAKISKAPYVKIWGTGKPQREFLHVDDLADACFFLMQNYDESGIINIGVGRDISIKELAVLIKRILDYSGQIKFDESKPDGTPRKLLEISKLSRLKWSPKLSLPEGIDRTYKWFVQKYS